MRSISLAIALLGALMALGAGCGDDGGSSGASGDGGGTLTVYSGREEEIVEPLFEDFEKQTGIEIKARYGDSAELAATIAEEGDRSPADVFFAQDPGSVGSVEQAGRLATLPQSSLDRVPERFRDPDKHWVGTSGRVRVVAYNTDELKEDELPNSIFGYADERWKGKIGLAPTNASFQAFVTAMRLSAGEERTRDWLEAIKENDPKLYEKNLQVVEAVGRGEIEVGFVNHYYLYLARRRTRTCRSQTTTCLERTLARLSAPPRSASSSRATSAPTRSGSSSSCCPMRASASIPKRRRKPSTRWSRASSRRRACRHLTRCRAPTSSSTGSAPSSRRRSSC